MRQRSHKSKSESEYDSFDPYDQYDTFVKQQKPSVVDE